MKTKNKLRILSDLNKDVEKHRIIEKYQKISKYGNHLINLFKLQSLRYENWHVMNSLITIRHKTEVWKTNVVTGDKHFMARRKLHNA